MNTKHTYIAVGLGVIIVIGAFLLPWKTYFSFMSTPGTATTSVTGDPTGGISFGAPSFTSLTTLKDAPAIAQAWDVFQRYIAAAKAHDLPTLTSLSYQLSPTCTDATRREECYGLMDSAVFFTSDLNQSHFTHVAYDDKQTVITTDYIQLPGATALIKTVFYFVRDTPTHTKFLGVRFCVGEETDPKQCIDTDPATRDSNGDGWWDDVKEMMMH